MRLTRITSFCGGVKELTRITVTEVPTRVLDTVGRSLTFVASTATTCELHMNKTQISIHILILLPFFIVNIPVHYQICSMLIK